MADMHVFQASGDACPICMALNGEAVPPNFEAHDGCMCQTVPQDDADNCEWSFEHTGNARDGNGDFDVISGFEVTVICPDGSEAGASGEFDGHPYTGSGADDFERWADDFEGAAGDLAAEICADCPEEEPFLCC
jgi:hypothetical protein